MLFALLIDCIERQSSNAKAPISIGLLLNTSIRRFWQQEKAAVSILVTVEGILIRSIGSIFANALSPITVTGRLLYSLGIIIFA